MMRWTPAHVVTVAHDRHSAGTVHEAQCVTCGWVGMPRTDMPAAERDGESHTARWS